MHSQDRILTTHVGSRPRPQSVVDVLFALDRGAVAGLRQGLLPRRLTRCPGKRGDEERTW
jgi:hypothetical protein